MSKFKNFVGKFALVFAMALMLGVMGHTNVYAATVGQQLTTPEAGWQRIEDSNLLFAYSSGFIEQTGFDGYSNSDGHVTSIIGDTIKFNFTKDKVRVICRTYSDRSNNIQINIDDSIIETFSTAVPSDGTKILVYEKTGLSNEEHHVKITNLETKKFQFDAIDIDTAGELKPYSIPISSIILDKTSLNLQIGQIYNLIATITPENATNKNVKWISSDPSIATVDESGKVTAIKEGTVTITATTQDGSNLSASCTVNVTTVPTNTGNAILNITMTNGNVKSYTVSMTKVNDFISWYNSRSSGSNGSPYYSFDKTDSLQPFTKKTEYVVFDKISSFEVDEYSK